MLKILHIIDRLSGGGPTRSMVALAKYGEALDELEHRVIALKREAYPVMLLMAKQVGMTVLRKPTREVMLRELEGADIVHVHFWNNPDFYDFLRSPLPAVRLLLWMKIFGTKPPQIITKELVDFADRVVVTNPKSLDHPVFRDLPEPLRAEKSAMVYGIADFDRLANLKPREHNGFNVGYIGTVNFSKMHPLYVPMSAGIRVPGIRFVVCGGGAEEHLEREAKHLDVVDKFEFRGYVENIKPVLEILDVFGYPLCEDTYATSDKSIQEAMYAGVPPVVFPHGGIQNLIQNNENGLVVRSEAEYREAIEHLYHHPDERARLGANVREYARRYFDSSKAAREFSNIYRDLMQRPKRTRRWKTLSADCSNRETEYAEESGAELFVESLGGAARPFAASMNAESRTESLEADKQIAASSPLLSSGEGGIFHYRNRYQSDGYLRFWSGLALLGSGRYGKAISEFRAALSLGFDNSRAQRYLARAEENLANENAARPKGSRAVEEYL